MKLDPSDLADLRPLLAEMARATLDAQHEQSAHLPNGRIGLTEPEAASAIGVARHVLRDARLRGDVSARRVGKRYIYSVRELHRYLSEGDR